LPTFFLKIKNVWKIKKTFKNVKKRDQNKKRKKRFYMYGNRGWGAESAVYDWRVVSAGGGRRWLVGRGRRYVS